MNIDDLTKNATPGKWTPPKPADDATVEVRWRGNVWSARLGLMTPDQRLMRDRTVAVYVGSGTVDSMPNFRHWYAIATVRSFWRERPEWLDWLITNDDVTAVTRLTKLEDFEATFRRDAGLEGDAPEDEP